MFLFLTVYGRKLAKPHRPFHHNLNVDYVTVILFLEDWWKQIFGFLNSNDSLNDKNRNFDDEEIPLWAALSSNQTQNYWGCSILDRKMAFNKRIWKGIECTKWYILLFALKVLVEREDSGISMYLLYMEIYVQPVAQNFNKEYEKILDAAGGTSIHHLTGKLVICYKC